MLPLTTGISVTVKRNGSWTAALVRRDTEVFLRLLRVTAALVLCGST